MTMSVAYVKEQKYSKKFSLKFDGTFLFANFVKNTRVHYKKNL